MPAAGLVSAGVVSAGVVPAGLVSAGVVPARLLVERNHLDAIGRHNQHPRTRDAVEGTHQVSRVCLVGRARRAPHGHRRSGRGLDRAYERIRVGPRDEDHISDRARTLRRGVSVSFVPVAPPHAEVVAGDQGGRREQAQRCADPVDESLAPAEEELEQPESDHEQGDQGNNGTDPENGDQVDAASSELARSIRHR
ncbi:hypothetical protein D9V28_12930 [Mycetocola zhadangensis]|uniref:Uncharacterized protein n=1 Tax=Mycetocola zhadangensis TaxID=1164595 RepID=A0A3L7ITJ0_9MICO|nr:hypothetical protein D9V28_12930 [Mycetocola zhadangensis]